MFGLENDKNCNKIIGKSKTNHHTLSFTLFVVLDLCTQIKKIFNFSYLQNKNIIIYTPNNILTNKKIKLRILLLNFALKTFKMEQTINNTKWKKYQFDYYLDFGISTVPSVCFIQAHEFHVKSRCWGNGSSKSHGHLLLR